MTRGTIQALREHKRAGNSIAVWDWENDRFRIIPADEIAIPEEESAEEPLHSQARRED